MTANLPDLIDLPPQALPWITVLAAVAKFKKWFFEDMGLENHAGLSSSKRSRASMSFARGSVRVHDDSGTACESCPKREHRVNVAFQLPPGTIATSIGRHTLFGALFRSAGAGWIGRGSDVLEWCRYARCCHTLCRDHAARVDGLRQSRQLPGQP
jgi:hypothetical protein